MDFRMLKKMHIKPLSKQALSKLKRGLPARIMAGQGMQIAVMPHQYDNIARSFMKSKGLNLTLSPPEIEANTTSEITGEGIFGKKADRFFKKVGIKKAVYAVGEALKPLAKTAIDTAAAAATAYGVPPSVVNFAKRETTGYLDNPESYQSKKGLKKLLGRAGSAAEEAASPYLADAGIDMEQVKSARKLAKNVIDARKGGAPSPSSATMKANAEEAFLSTLKAYMDSRAASSAPQSTNPYDLMDADGIIGNGFAIAQSPNVKLAKQINKSIRFKPSSMADMGGVGLYAGASGRGLGMGMCSKCSSCSCGEGLFSQLKDIGKKYVNSGRKMVGAGHPALVSQNLDANFLASNQYPPSYQHRK